MRQRTAVAALSGAISAVAAGVAARRRRRTAAADDAGGQVHAVTVLAPLETVREAWEAQAPHDGPKGTIDLRLAPGDRGTELRVAIDGRDGDTRAALRRLKSGLECGEVVTTEDQPSGRTGRQEAATRAVTDRLRSWSPA